ncbi:MAG: AAA family ATPase, partial [Desulfobacterota bacterium]|nr:AAA family ATPase [Thermodesulfobacteriota bacterium]
MKKIFVCSTGAQSGQSLAAWCIAEIFNSRGFRIGFFKPFITRPISLNGQIVDKDALLIKQYFNLPDELNLLSPILPEGIPGDEVTKEEQRTRIEECYERIKEDKDVLIIMGSEKIFYDPDSPYLPDGALVNQFDTPVLLVDKFQNESMSIYSILAIDSFLKNKVKIVFLNQIPLESIDSVSNKLVPFFQKRGAPLIFLLPKDRILSSLTVKNIVELIHGEVLTGEGRLGNLVESTSISSTHLKGSLYLFRQIYNKIILLGLEAENLNSPLISPKVTGILFTGGRRPAPVIVNTCGDLDVPLIVSPVDTFVTMERIQKQQVHITENDVYKLKRFIQLLGGETAIQKIIE